MTRPLVAGLLASNRPAMCDTAQKRFLAQDYPNKILHVDEGSGCHGRKMDRLFALSWAPFVCVVDDDDAYSPQRISKLLQPMLDDPKRLCVGTSLVYYVDERIGKAWLYDNWTVMQNWKANPSLFWLAAPCYRRTAYDAYGPWEDLKCGADLRFLHRLPRETVFDLRDAGLMVARIHSQNAAAKETNGPAWTPVPFDSLPSFYSTTLGATHGLSI